MFILPRFQELKHWDFVKFRILFKKYGVFWNNTYASVIITGNFSRLNISVYWRRFMSTLVVVYFGYFRILLVVGGPRMSVFLYFGRHPGIIALFFLNTFRLNLSVNLTLVPPRFKVFRQRIIIVCYCFIRILKYVLYLTIYNTPPVLFSRFIFQIFSLLIKESYLLKKGEQFFKIDKK